MSYQMIGFLGLGLIGGSIAKTIRKKHPTIEIIANDPNAASLAMAHKDGIIRNGQALPLSAFGQCDLIFLCAPVGVNISYLRQLKDLIQADSIITDVSSVKGQIRKAVTEEGLSSNFIGGHPMAGAELIGYEHAKDNLLENAYYLITHTDDIRSDRVREFSSFIKSLGAKIMLMDPREHDHATAAISHLPHIISASLVNFVQASDDDKNTLKAIASGGFRDITRISSSSPLMWEHICLANRDEILGLFEAYCRQLDQFRERIAAGDGEQIRRLFADAKEYRDSLPIRGKGALPDIYEFYCDLIDEIGGIASVASILSAGRISIRNIGIVHNREFSDGVLKLEFYDEDAMEQAMRLLAAHHYTIHRR